MLCVLSSQSRPNFSESFWFDWTLSMCLLDCLVPSVVLQIPNDVQTRSFFLTSSTKNFYPTTFLMPFVVIGTSVHYQVSYKILTPIKVHLHYHLLLHTWISSKAQTIFIISSNVLLKSPCLWYWCFCWTYFVQVWLLWLCQMQHSCPKYFKGQGSDWKWNHYSQVCWHQGTICLLTTSG